LKKDSDPNKPDLCLNVVVPGDLSGKFKLVRGFERQLEFDGKDISTVFGPIASL